MKERVISFKTLFISPSPTTQLLVFFVSLSPSINLDTFCAILLYKMVDCIFRGASSSWWWYVDRAGFDWILFHAFLRDVDDSQRNHFHDLSLPGNHVFFHSFLFSPLLHSCRQLYPNNTFHWDTWLEVKMYIYEDFFSSSILSSWQNMWFLFSLSISILNWGLDRISDRGEG